MCGQFCDGTPSDCWACHFEQSGVQSTICDCGYVEPRLFDKCPQCDQMDGLWQGILP